MKIEHLQYFLTLAKASSISKAADELFISQQQLTRVITILEDELNVVLFIRTKKGISLTKAGQDLKKYAQNILKEYYSMKNHFNLQYVQNKTDVYYQTMNCTLYLPPCYALYASDFMKHLHQIAPNVNLTIHDKLSGLKENYGHTDAITFWALPINPTEQLLPDSTHLKTLQFSTSQNYLVFNKTFTPPNNLSEQLSSIVTVAFAHTKTYNERFVSSSVRQILDTVTDNDDVALLPDFVLPKVRPLYPDLAFAAIENDTTPLSVVYPETHILTEADEVVINFIKTYIQNLQILAKQVL